MIAFSDIAGTIPTEIGLITSLVGINFSKSARSPVAFGAQHLFRGVWPMSTNLIHWIHLTSILKGGNNLLSTIPSELIQLTRLANLVFCK